MSSQLLPFPSLRLRPNSPPHRTRIPAPIYTHPAATLLELCASPHELRQIIPLVYKHGLCHEHFFQTKLVGLLCKYGCVNEAASVFEPIEDKIDVLYHTMLKGYAKHTSLDEVASFYVRMRRDGVLPVVYDFSYLLKLCGDKGEIRVARQIHGQVVCSGLSVDVIAMAGLVSMYAKCKQIEEAYKVFDRMPDRDSVSWNTIISGYVQNGLPIVALELVTQMHDEMRRPDSVTIVTILPTVADMGAIKIGKLVHAYVIRAGFESFVNVSTALLDMYSKCGYVGLARMIFDRMTHRTVVSWNSMIDCYVRGGNPAEALAVFEKMLGEQVEPDGVTIMAALRACADSGDLDRGKLVHALLDQLNLSSNVPVMNSLISMYFKCKKVDIAASIFKNMDGKTLVSWNAMILGFAQNGYINAALNCFHEIWSRGVKPDSFTMVSVIAALAELSVARQAKWIHALCIRTCLEGNVFVMTALVDMYAKCGEIQKAKRLFDLMDERHVTTWNAMIDGYGTHGLGKDALELFRRMQKGTVKPNDITFLCLLSACSHSGMVEEGLCCFNSMKKDYSIEPAMDHYGAMVDLLGRAGRLDEAWKFIQNMPVEPEINIYGAVLGACRIHKNVELGEKAAQRLFELNPDEGGYHVLLANIYAGASMWDKVAEVRTMMEKSGIKKTPGCSLVELKNKVHSFYSGGTDHPESKKIYSYLEELGDELKAAGYIPSTTWTVDVEDGVKQQLCNTHSERLAIAFALLNTAPGTTIQVRKNLRVCDDCHNATKYISLVTGREIIVRDMHRFHHFKKGICSCGDYW